jgi:hypothetical protein
MKEKPLDGLQRWIMWRLIASCVIVTAIAVWLVAFDPSEKIVPLTILALVVITRIGTDIFLFVRRRRAAREVNPPTPIPDETRDSI